MTNFKLIITFLLIFPTLVVSGPLNLKMGMSANEIKGLHGVTTVEGEEFVFQITEKNKINDEIQSTYIIAPPIAGLCKVVMFSKFINSSENGDELKTYFGSFVKALRSKYGNPDASFDFIPSDSPWQRSTEWMMGLLTKSHKLSTEWFTGYRLPDNLAIVHAFAHATTQTRGRVTIEYYFKNYSDCTNEKIKNISPKGL